MLQQVEAWCPANHSTPMKWPGLHCWCRNVIWFCCEPKARSFTTTSITESVLLYEWSEYERVYLLRTLVKEVEDEGKGKWMAVKTENPDCTYTQTTQRFDPVKDCDNGNSLHQNYIGHYPLLEIYLKHVAFWELALYLLFRQCVVIILIKCGCTSCKF